jgi:hypothetical protein
MEPSLREADEVASHQEVESGAPRTQAPMQSHCVIETGCGPACGPAALPGVEQSWADAAENEMADADIGSLELSAGWEVEPTSAVSRLQHHAHCDRPWATDG